MLNSNATIKRNRLLIIGAPGSGKTSLARRLGPILGLDVYHLDSLFWKPGWEKVSHPERMNILNALVKNDNWIIEGNYPDMLELQLKFADTIIILELSRLLCYWRVIRRKFEAIVKPLPDIALGCPDKLDLRFLMSIWEYPLKDLPLIERVLINDDNKVPIIRLLTTASVNNFVKSLEYQQRSIE